MEIRFVMWSLSSDCEKPAWSHSADWLDGFSRLWLGNASERIDLIESVEEFRTFQKSFIESGEARKLVVVPIETLGKSDFLWQEILKQFDKPMPEFRVSDQLTNISKEFTFPGIGLVFDRTAKVSSLRDTTVLIPHWESAGFLRLCLESISKVFSESARPEILVIDDNSSEKTFSEISRVCRENNARVERIFRDDHGKVADVGKVLDEGLKLVSTKYVCMLDADTVILAPEFITRPIEILADLQYSSAGLDTGLAEAYHSNSYWNKRVKITRSRTNLPGYTTITNNLYRVMITADAQAVSAAIGFSRSNGERKFRDQIGRVIRKIDLYTNKYSPAPGFSRELIKCKFLNSNFPNMPPTSDNGVNANYWMDSNGMGWKANIPITSYGFLTPRDGVCFQNISGLLVHVALSTRALSLDRREVEDAGTEFYEAVQEIVSNEFNFDVLAKKVIHLSLSNKNT